MILATASPAGLTLGLVATAAYLLPAGLRLSPARARQALVLAWLLHLLVLTLPWWQAEPRFGFAPALSVTAWLALTVYAVESHVFPQLRVRWALAALGGLAVLLAVLFPGQPLHLRASAWWPLHWALGVASYGLFAMAVVHAMLMTRAEKQIRRAAHVQGGIPLLTLERLTFRFVSAGFVLLTATLVAGGLFGDVLYQHEALSRRWDHKTVFSLLSWITFAILLLGRWRFGWRGRTAVRVLYLGSGLLLLAYVGSRFVLEVILQR